MKEAEKAPKSDFIRIAILTDRVISKDLELLILRLFLVKIKNLRSRDQTKNEMPQFNPGTTGMKKLFRNHDFSKN